MSFHFTFPLFGKCDIKVASNETLLGRVWIFSQWLQLGVFDCHWGNKQIYIFLSLPAGLFAVVALFPRAHTVKVHNGDHQNLSAVPTDIPIDSNEIYLTYNNIETLETDGFSYQPNCTGLYLSRNSISVIEPLAFAGLSKLTSLSLEGNKITVLEKEAFSGITEIVRLDLSANLIYFIEPRFFQGMGKLQRLKLQQNKLIWLKSMTFLGLSSCTYLSLKWNDISVIQSGAFFGFEARIVLDLSNNKIQRLNYGAVVGLSTCYSLDLSYNSILEVEPGTFRHTTFLDQLHLSANNISTMPSFEGLFNLRALFMHANKITSVPSGTLSDLLRCKEMHLEGNSISHVDLGAFNGLTSLNFFMLYGDKLTEINGEMWQGLNSLIVLSLRDNNISNILPGGFHHLPKVEFLDLNNNNLTTLNENSFEFGEWICRGLVEVVYFWVGRNESSNHTKCSHLPTRKSVVYFHFVITFPCFPFLSFLPQWACLFVVQKKVWCWTWLLLGTPSCVGATCVGWRRLKRREGLVSATTWQHLHSQNAPMGCRATKMPVEPILCFAAFIWFLTSQQKGMWLLCEKQVD